MNEEGEATGNGDTATLLGEALARHQDGDLDAAVALYGKILTADPTCADALHLLGVAALQKGDPEKAAQLIAQAIALHPAADFYSNLGEALKAGGHLDRAGDAFAQAISLDPRSAAAHYNLSTVHSTRQEFEQSIKECEKALEIKANFSEAYGGMGQALEALGRYDEALSCYGRALEISPQPTQPKTRLRMATALPVIPESKDAIVAARERMGRELDRLSEDKLAFDDPLGVITNINFYLAYHAMNDRALQEKLARFYLQACPSLDWTAPHCEVPVSPDSGPDSGKKVRVGVVSMHLYFHTIGRLVHGLINHLPRERLEVVVFRPPGKEDKLSAGIDRAADKMVRIPKNLAAARAAIAAETLDVLFYPDIGMEPFTYFLAFSRLAPVQCVTWGHPVTTGIPNMDYFLSCADMEPADMESSGADGHYCERLIRLAAPPTYYEQPKIPEDLASREDFGFSDENRLYVCPQNLFKLHPDFDAVFAQILRRDGEGLLVLIEGMQAHWNRLFMERFSKSFADLADRVRFVPRMDASRFFALLNAADVILDCPYFSGGNTTFEALAVAAPIITMPGEFMRGRVSAGLLQRMGLNECIAGDFDDYVDRAVTIAGDKEKRADISAKIRAAWPKLYRDGESLKEFESFFMEAAAAAGHGQSLSAWPPV
ncbi:MAG: tetratricopeptide repeat protein [Alphaproteobacteria bacterium]|nr:tetratricopeptide repeat protein [Alphaproteobacteria bacterium]